MKDAGEDEEEDQEEEEEDQDGGTHAMHAMPPFTNQPHSMPDNDNSHAPRESHAQVASSIAKGLYTERS